MGRRAHWYASRWGSGLVLAVLIGLAASLPADAQAPSGDLGMPLAEAVDQIFLMLTGSRAPANLGLRGQIDRATELVYGPDWQQHVSVALVNRVQTLLSVVKPGNPNVSLLSKLMAIEWALNQGLYEMTLAAAGKDFSPPSLRSMPLQPVTVRVEWLESLLYGSKRTGGLVQRADALARDVWGGTSLSRIGVKKVTVSQNAGTVQVRLLGTISNERERLSKVGDAVPILVLEDLRLENALVVPRGMVGVVHVDEAEPPGPLGRPGKLSASGQVWAIDGTPLGVRLRLGPAESREAAAAGAAVGGAVAGGPLGVAAGLLVRGEARTLSKGESLLADIGPIPGFTSQPVPEAILPP